MAEQHGLICLIDLDFSKQFIPNNFFVTERCPFVVIVRIGLSSLFYICKHFCDILILAIDIYKTGMVILLIQLCYNHLQMIYHIPF